MPVTGGFFGSGGTEQTSVTRTDTRAATGQSYADRGGQSLSGFQLERGASLTLTDLGAVDKAFSFSKELVDRALQSASLATADAADAYKTAQQQGGAINADKLVRYGLGAVLVVAGMIAYAVGRK